MSTPVPESARAECLDCSAGSPFGHGSGCGTAVPTGGATVNGEKDGLSFFSVEGLGPFPGERPGLVCFEWPRGELLVVLWKRQPTAEVRVSERHLVRQHRLP